MHSMPEPGQRLCIECGYVLDHLTEPRCPECGRAFDFANPSTFRVASSRRPMPRSLAAIAWLHCLTLAVLTIDVVSHEPGGTSILDDLHDQVDLGPLALILVLTSPFILILCLVWPWRRWLGIADVALTAIMVVDVLRAWAHL